MGREGAKLVIADLQAEKAQSVASELQSQGAQALAVEVDVAHETSVRRMAASTFKRFGRVDILVNVAGIYYPNRVMKNPGCRLLKKISEPSNCLKVNASRQPEPNGLDV
jgi:NAD(P)-dependent dehydrogenase (short-subunit alcohol dehydrogenase family)